MAEQDHGKAPVDSAVVKLVEDKVAIFRRNGLPSATVGTNVKLIVTMNRRRKVLNAKAEMEEEEFELTLDQFVALFVAEPLFSVGVTDLIGITVNDKAVANEEDNKEAQAAR